jgi:wyosine [tRNA(Phe)-imidazoG37] synthetase (radical SAM superfamily)
VSAGERAFRHVYGPVPSRRLGRSLGVDLVPFKTCSYDCVYCQLGRTTVKTMERKEYVPVEEVLSELREWLRSGEACDTISLAGSGEPTLHSGIGTLVRAIKGMTKIPVAVLTNGSLLWMEEVQEALLGADLVLPSLDAGDAHLFRWVNRPVEEISFDRMVDGLESFTKRFRGEVWLEVLLLDGVTAYPAQVEKIAALVRRIGPSRVQLNTASRPPAELFARPVSEGRMLALASLFPGRVEVLTAREEVGAPGASGAGPSAPDILTLLARRPCTASDVAEGLGLHLNEALKHLEHLCAAGTVKTATSDGRTFYIVTERSPRTESPGERQAG